MVSDGGREVKREHQRGQTPNGGVCPLVTWLWADGQIGGVGLAAGAWAAVRTCFIRAGVGTAVRKAQE